MNLDWPHSFEEDEKISKSIQKVVVVSASTFAIMCVTGVVSLFLAQTGDKTLAMLDIEEMKVQGGLGKLHFLNFFLLNSEVLLKCLRKNFVQKFFLYKIC